MNLTKGKERKQYKHGHASTYNNSKTYISWRALRQRCLNPNHQKYKNYGGKGITVHETWNKFVNFLSDMGERPEGTTIDRIDRDGNYEPSNCRWADASTQNKNRRFKHAV
jgi:hypothetical protein